MQTRCRRHGVPASIESRYALYIDAQTNDILRYPVLSLLFFDLSYRERLKERVKVIVAYSESEGLSDKTPPPSAPKLRRQRL
jgi:hypothetical protein